MYVAQPNRRIGLSRRGLSQTTDASTLDTMPVPQPPMQPGYIQQTVQDGTVVTSRITFLGQASGDPTAPGSVMPGNAYAPPGGSQTPSGTCIFGTSQLAQTLCSSGFWLIAAAVVAALFMGGRR